MKNRKSVIFLSPLFPTGGITSWTKNMLDYIQQAEIQDVYHVDGSVKFKNPNNAIHPLYRVVSGIVDTIHIFYLLVKNCFKYHPAVIHIATSGSLSLCKDVFYLIIAKCFRAKCIFHYRFGRIPELSERKNWEWNLLCFNMKHAYRIIVIDAPSYKALCDTGFESKIRLIGNPCSPKVALLANQDVEEKQKNHYVFVGQIIRTKGVYELLDAFSQLRNESHLTMIGPYDEKIKNDLLTISQRREGDWFCLLGNQPSEVVLEYMSKADALILPSYTEGFPNVVLEAMAMGCPVLATPVGAIRDMIDADSEQAAGICFEAKSADAIIEVLDKFSGVDNHLDYAINGKRKVLACYTMKSIFSQYQKVWYER